MDSQYINCPKCGTRNFTDDKVCGVCKTNLTPIISQKNTQPTTQPTSYKAIFLVIGGLLFVYYAFIKDSETSKNSSNKSYSESHLESSPETQLAVINDETGSPKQITINLFSGHLTSLNNKYPNKTKQEIANAMVAGHNIITKNGQTDSLLEFTTAFDAYSRNVDSKFKFSIEEGLTLFIKISYQI